jgi:hypothetical protein
VFEIVFLIKLLNKLKKFLNPCEFSINISKKKSKKIPPKFDKILGCYTWGSQLGALTPHHQAFFWRCCRGERRFLQGESLTLNLYFVICFALFYFVLASFYQKYKKK